MSKAEQTTPSPMTLAQALVAAQVAAQAVGKESRNEWHKYDYASSESVITEARAALGACGLSVYVRKSALIDPLVLSTELVVLHTGGENLTLEYETPICEDKGRPRDKAVAAARTYTLAYALRDLLLLPRVERGTDVDQRDDREHAPPKPPDFAPEQQAAFVEQCRERLAILAREGSLNELRQLSSAIVARGLPASDLDALRALAKTAKDLIVARQRKGVEA